MKFHGIRVVVVCSMVAGIFFSSQVHAGELLDDFWSWLTWQTPPFRKEYFKNVNELIDKKREEKEGIKRAAMLRKPLKLHAHRIGERSFIQIMKEHNLARESIRREQERIRKVKMRKDAAAVVSMRERMVFWDGLLSNYNDLEATPFLSSFLLGAVEKEKVYISTYCEDLKSLECKLFMEMIAREEKRRLNELAQQEQKALETDNDPNVRITRKIIQMYEDAVYDINDSLHLTPEEKESVVKEIHARLWELEEELGKLLEEYK